MIVVKNKADCCGCTACYSVCPQKAISMQQDQEGFLYPFVEISKCIDCKLCDSVCPIENKVESKMFDRKAYVLRAKDVGIVSTSTSGGFVTPLGEWILNQGGVICGATYNEEYKVVHKISGGAEEFRDSKYVQSDLGDCFSEIKKHLMHETKVCFIGTPCQVYGLKSYLRKEYDNLVTVDLVCHGTPSPKLWKKYLDEQKDKYHSEIDDIVFRNKTYGYHSGTMRIRFKNQFVYYGSARVDSMLKSFFAEISSRPSCYKCRFKSVERCSDFTIYDCWHANNLVEGLVDDDKGFTNLIVQSLKGERILDRIADRYELYATNLEKAIELDGTMICNSAEPHPRRDEYYLNLDKETLRAHIQNLYQSE